MKENLNRLQSLGYKMAGFLFLLLVVLFGWLLIRGALVNDNRFSEAESVTTDVQGTYTVTQIDTPTTEPTAVVVEDAVDEETAVSPPTATTEPTQPADPTPPTEEATAAPFIAAVAAGPLRVSQSNSRYFEDPNGNIVYLTGSHTWSNLQDNGGSDPPPVFDYPAYLDFLEANNHNFFRLWSWEESRWTVETTDNNYWFFPMPYERTGPGTALDGKARFDLNQFNQAYFDRLRERVVAANERGIYVAIVLFNGWSVADNKGGFGDNNPWRGHPFNEANNVNGIDGDTNNDNSGEEVHELGNTAVTAIQEAYVRKVIDTVNDLDNVLFEISNESHGDSQAWQYHMINFIKDYEATLPQQHPVGMTVEYPNGSNRELFNSPADWISPNGDVNNPDLADGRKVILADTDHLCGICGNRQWVWKSFTQGENPIFMDGYDGAGYGVGGAGFDFNNSTWVSLRENLGFARSYAQRVDLATMEPRPDLSSSGYALASDKAFIVYDPSGGSVQVDLTAVTGQFSVEWLDPETGDVFTGATVEGNAVRNFIAPFSGDAVLYLCWVGATSSLSTPVSGATDTNYLPLVMNGSPDCS
ncbi:MAG: DUF6298 domain-containing protein [Chloroflexota bacterium]